jgi:hypothetical protein
MPRTHILNQYLWPDGAPTAIYAEQLGAAILAAGKEVVLAGGTGVYRLSSRPAPACPRVGLAHRRGRRGNLLTVAHEYASLTAAYQRYIAGQVGRGDVVIVSSAPPTTIGLHRQIRKMGARSVYWLQDYYPELLRGLVDYPAVVRGALAGAWGLVLEGWDVVVKAAGNLGYSNSNARVIRNWPTLTFPVAQLPRPRTALYSGNLGYGHDVQALVNKCEELRSAGYQITVRGDGPGMARLPVWLACSPPLTSDDELRRSYLESETHLVAGHPAMTQAVFPSKIWNTIASKRRLVCTGFAGAMVDELAASLASRPSEHLVQWQDLINSLH